MGVYTWVKIGCKYPLQTGQYWVQINRQVNQIVLISGDADFVHAAKLARREGIDFILDPMWSTIRPDLYEHVDGLRSVCPRPATKQNGAAEGSK